MVVKKSDLYSHLWESCDALRGGMDASQYKDYVLVLLFLKYVSDRAGAQDALLDVPEDASFSALVALKNKTNIGEGVNTVLARLAEVNDLRGVIDVADFNDENKLGRGQDMVDRLTKLIGIFENPALNFAGNRADGDDLLGDAYEYLMRHFATESGKSKGQFYTPAEVSRILATVIGLQDATSPSQTIHDPACGSGSLLLKALDVAKDAAGVELTAYGQEMDNATAALARMNMFIHGAGTAEIWNDNTLSRPHFKDSATQLKRHDYIVANPPFSVKAWTNGVNTANDPFGRFEYGVPPAKNGDYAFLLHILSSLKSTGTAGVILPHGVLFRGNAEAEIRRNLVQRGYIKTIIGLPANLFYGTGIPACIIVLDKAEAAARTGIFMVDASRGFAKDGPKNRLRERDIHRIIDVVTNAVEVPGYSRFVPLAEITDPANDFNLNIPRYIESAEPEDLHDLDAHLRGGIPERDVELLAPYWDILPTLRGELFEPADRSGYLRLTVSQEEAAAVISASPELDTLRQEVARRFDTWWEQERSTLADIGPATAPKSVGHQLAETLLANYRDVGLVDEYAIYQSTREYWHEVMSDDVYLVADAGWDVAAKPTRVAPKSNQRIDFEIDKEKFTSELLPADVLAGRFLATELEAVDAAEAELNRVDAELADLLVDEGSEDGLLADAVGDKGAFTKAAIEARRGELREFHADSVASDELAALHAAQEELEETKNRLAEFASQHAKPGAVLVSAANKNGTLSKTKVKTRLNELDVGTAERAVAEQALELLEAEAQSKKAIKTADAALSSILEAAGPADDEFNVERDLLDRCEQLLDERASAAEAVKDAHAALNAALAQRYDSLATTDVAELALEGKWRTALAAAVFDEVDRLAFLLAERVRELAARYETPLPELVERSAHLERMVEEHLARMGFAWR